MVKKSTHHVRVKSIVASLACAVALLAPAAASAGTFPGANGRIIMTDITGPAYHFTSVKPDGTDDKVVLSDSVSKYDVEYSPDGTKITYVQEVSSNPQIFIASADGTNIQQLTQTSSVKYSPSFSPDGTKLLFSQAVSSQVHIFRMDIDGGNQTNLTSSGIYYDPEYSPDGTKIIARFDSTDDEIYSMNADGSNIVNLTNNSVDEYTANWSPDGTKIVYSSTVSSSFEIFTMNTDGTGKTQLTSDGIGYHDPVYSPDGTKLAFIDTLAPSLTHVSNADGTNITDIPVGWGRELSWQPLTRRPSSSSPNPTVSLSSGKATINVAALYTDAYDGIDKASVAATSTPTSGTTSVDATTGVITYTPKTTALNTTLWSRLVQGLIPTAHAATTDSFTYRVCSLSNSSFCSTGTITVNLLGAPKTGVGKPVGLSPLALMLGTLSLVSLGLGLRLARRRS